MKRLLKVMPFIILVLALMACSPNNDNSTNENENTNNNSASDELNNANDDVNTNDNDDVEANAQKQDTDFESGEGGFLWRVDNDDTTVYLQGTIHLGSDDFYPLNEAIESAYDEADVVVPEIDITSVGAFSSFGSTMKHGVYDDGSTIEDHISGDVYDKLMDVLDEHGLATERMGLFKPWILEATISQLLAEELDYMDGVDMYFLERAKEDDKEIIELESVSEQFDVLAGQSDEFQEQQLEATLDSLDYFEDMMNEMFSVYLAGDEDALLEMLFPEEAEMDDDYADFMTALNDDRNVGMAETITEFLEDDSGETYFVIVGTAHLVKDPHIRTLLEEAGYQVEKVY